MKDVSYNIRQPLSSGIRQPLTAEGNYRKDYSIIAKPIISKVTSGVYLKVFGRENPYISATHQMIQTEIWDMI